VTREDAGKVPNYDQHVALRDRLGFVVADVFWGGRNAKPNVEAKGSCAIVAARILRANFEQWPSRIDVKRDATQAGLFRRLRDLASVYADKHGVSLRDIANNHPDQGDTFYLGARTSQASLRVYQPGLKRAQEEGRTGDAITESERNAVRVELEFKPNKKPAKVAAATLSPDQLWGVSPWIAEFASEVFAMNVQPITISDRRESNRNRALRFMATQYRGHLADLLRECQGDVSLLGSTILDLADIPHTQ
jgi:DNA relaxase NicK